jgi:hypothetical protein
MKRPSIASTVWFLAFVAVSVLLFRIVFYSDDKRDDDIVFAPKNFFDNPDLPDTDVAISGTLTGPELTYPNNTVVVVCYKDRKDCLTYQVQQIGHNHVGRMDYPNILPVTKWDKFEVVAVEDVAHAPWRCRKTTITLQRKTQTAVWVEEPINQAAAACKDAATKIYKWTIEDSPRWKDIHKRANR